MVKILDCTTRDGGHTTNWNFNEEFVENLIYLLKKLNVSYYEIGYRNHKDTEGKGFFYTCSPEFLEKFFKIKGSLQLGVMTDCKRYDANDFPGKEKDCLDFVRIACHPDKISETLSIAENLYNKNYKVFVQLMEISNVDENGYIELFKWENKNILESLYIADSYGVLNPEDIYKYYNKLKILGYKNVSFHGHNNSGTVLENSLRAVELGVYSVDTTFGGIGRSGGNLSLQDLVCHLN